MKALLIGAGAVGLGMAAALIDAGIQTDLVARGETLEAIRQNGITRKGIFKEVTIPAGSVTAFEAADESGEQYDYILVCSKTTGNAEIAQNLKNAGKLKSDGCIVLFQNGFYNERAYFGCAEKNRIFSASFAIGFKRPEPSQSEVTVFSSPVNIGSLFGGNLEKVKPLAKALEAGGIPSVINDRIEKVLWAKMLYNCTLNPLSAVLGVNYGGLVQCDETIQIMNKIIEEIFAVIKAAGYTTFWQDAEEYKTAFYEKILPPTYSHRSSTLQDMERKIKTEIDSLTGVVVALGKENGVLTPYNEMLYRLVKTKESLYYYK